MRISPPNKNIEWPNMTQHIFKILITAAMISVPAIPLIHYFFGHTGVRLFCVFILPSVSVVLYTLYINHLDDNEPDNER